MRIIGGQLRGRKLHHIRGKNIRPTADQLRETIYNILQFKTHGTTVLDLFAGTGSMGIEALSRGAHSATFIDNHSFSLIRENIETCRLAKKAKIIKWNILDNLNCIKTIQPVFDMVFIDPPYNKGMVRPALINLHNTRAILSNACIVVEHAATEAVPDNLDGYEIVEQREYRKTHISFLKGIRKK
jgi:16S rRNA (guanine966-N2)-methyltransferase